MRWDCRTPLHLVGLAQEYIVPTRAAQDDRRPVRRRPRPRRRRTTAVGAVVRLCADDGRPLVSVEERRAYCRRHEAC
ncbi:hypothetical protein ACFV2H_48545 [Streptomyces sp. NPDC059629]|uniref:hypothetical protein n=1 Tax=Streptomyces sp. NPDC059629 TaxID=3346889 RepID=UPI00369CCADB